MDLFISAERLTPGKYGNVTINPQAPAHGCSELHYSPQPTRRDKPQRLPWAHSGLCAARPRHSGGNVVLSEKLDTEGNDSVILFT